MTKVYAVAESVPNPPLAGVSIKKSEVGHG